MNFRQKSFKLKKEDTSKLKYGILQVKRNINQLLLIIIQKAVGGIIVYDVTKRNTFDNVLQWLSDLKKGGEKGCVVALVGNKIDLLERNNRKREVSYQEANELAKRNGMLFYETSALSSVRVNDAFEDLLQNIYTERRKSTTVQKDKLNTVNLTNGNKNKEDEGCCKG